MVVVEIESMVMRLEVNVYLKCCFVSKTPPWQLDYFSSNLVGGTKIDFL